MFFPATQIIFGASVVALFYVYIGYPLLVYAVSRLRPKTVKRREYTPKVTILITAYNEEKVIREKLKNTFQINYPLRKGLSISRLRHKSVKVCPMTRTRIRISLSACRFVSSVQTAFGS